jgi:CubicO group peptidase (beta-lactamase class C family)
MEPGSVFEYNDVRVNVLAYSLLQVLRQPLPQVLKTHVMDPIGASSTWRWFGYDHAWVTVDGLSMKSVTGGGHSGGGMFVNTFDQARFGLLFTRNGHWMDKQIIDPAWIEMAVAPSPARATYGYMWWLLESDDKNVPDNLFYAAGFGGNFIIVDQTNDMVIVTRWLEPSQLQDFVSRVYKALKD